MTQNLMPNQEISRDFPVEFFSDEELIPAHLAYEKSSGVNFKFMAAGGLLMVVIAGLLVYGLMTASSYYYTVNEVQDYYQQGLVAFQTGTDEMALTRRIRVNGEVVEGSEDWQAEQVTLRFSIQDETGATLPIVFYGPRPDNFQRAASAIIEGNLLLDGSFQADTLLLKCPSRYEEDPEEIFVQSTR